VRRAARLRRFAIFKNIDASIKLFAASFDAK
jgi:hypothetical protein